LADEADAVLVVRASIVLPGAVANERRRPAICSRRSLRRATHPVFIGRLTRKPPASASVSASLNQTIMAAE